MLAWIRAMTKKSILQVHSRGICFLLAVVIAAILSLHTTFASLLPIADGQGYAMRAFALYGFLHSGQWAQFADLLSRPNQSILPPHDVLFFLLPKSLAGTGAYVALQNGVTHLMLAYAIFLMAQLLNRPAWAPVIFLLCAVNNIALTDFYAFYLDMSFLSVGLLAIAFQMKAWSENSASTSLTAGVLLGLLFFIKPANALIFLAIYILAEIFYAATALRSGETKNDRRNCFLRFFKYGGCKILGFIPVLFVVFLCGGAQTILQLIEQNEVSRKITDLACTGLLRLFYFPLCLSVCYQVILLGGLLVAAMIWSKWIPVSETEKVPSAFPMRLFIPILVSYLIFGEFFSFWMLVKPMRALLLMLPLFWFGFCWIWEKGRLRLEPLLVAALIYASLAFSQKAFNVMGTHDQLVEDNYQLTMSSWTEMPTRWHRGWSLNQTICDFVIRDLPPSGIICVNAIEIRNALAWRLGKAPLLEGKASPYEVLNLFDYKGDYFDRALVGANEVVLITFFPVQSSRLAWLQSMGILSYGNEQWCGENAVARQVEMPSIQGEPMGHEFIFGRPLTATEVDRANQSAPFATATRADVRRLPDSIYGRHFSRAQGWQLLQAWFGKRFD
jgi:hypothetical protein